MKAASCFYFGVILWLPSLLTGRLGSPMLSNATAIRYTNIGDISAKDLVRIADESTPADKRFVNPGETEDSDERIVEAEASDPTNNPKLAAPTEQQQTFVNFLKQQYRKTFPEYGKETEGDYMTNKDLADNLDVQPETALLGHSDTFHERNGRPEDINDFRVPDDLPAVDNLESYDGDSSLVNALQQRESFRAQGLDTSLLRHAARHHKNIMTKEEDAAANDSLENTQTDAGEQSASDEATSGTAGIRDGQSGTDEDNENTTETDEEAEELRKMKEKTEEERLWDAIEKLRQNKQRLGKKKKNKKKNLKKGEKNAKQANDDGSASGEILKEFEKMKEANDNNTHSSGGEKPTGDIVEESRKPWSGNQVGKKINHIAEDAEVVAGDVILDFLDKLLQKDPKKLRHDVLSIAKEMQNEGGVHPDVSDDGGPKMSPSQTGGAATNLVHEERVDDLRNNTEREADRLISDLDDKYGKEGQVQNVKETGNGGDSYAEQEDYSEIYDEPHSQPEIYPDGIRENWDHSGDKQTSVVSEKVGQNETNNPEPNYEDGFEYEEFKEEALKIHNEYRRRHNVVALEWSEDLAKKAHGVAGRLVEATTTAAKREFENRGESIAILPYLTKHIAKSAIEKWYSEITKFSFTNPKIKPETRDFTQIIWKGSKKVGMGFAHSGNKRTLVVALYSPAGNRQQEIQGNLNTLNVDPYADI